jgi:hypothetical protein
MTITVDSSTQTIAYTDVSNGASGDRPVYGELRVARIR